MHTFEKVCTRLPPDVQGTYKLILCACIRTKHKDLYLHVCENLHTCNIHTHKAAALCLFYVPVCLVTYKVYYYKLIYAARMCG